MRTVAAVSGGGTWKTPKPSWGIVVVSLRVIGVTVMTPHNQQGHSGLPVCEACGVEFMDYDTRLAAYAIIVDGSSGTDRVLLALWNEADEPRWTLPGGGVELYESVEEGAIREVREESGYDVELTGLLGVHSYVVPPERRILRSRRPMRAVRVIFTATVTGGELTQEVDGTTDEARWFALDEVAALPQVGLVEIGLEMWRSANSAD